MATTCTRDQHLSDNAIKAQNFALESHVKKLETVVTPKLLSTCVSKGILRRPDRDMINGTKNTAEKVAILKQLIVKNPQKFDQIMNIVKENKNTKRVANIIQKTKVAREKSISEHKRIFKVLSELAKCLGKEINMKVEIESDITLVIRELIESVQKSHPELQNLSMAELQDDLIRKHREKANWITEMSNLIEEYRKTCRKNDEKDREIEKLRSELVNRENWIRCCETEIANLEKLTRACRCHQVKVDKELQTTPNISCPSTETTPKISCPSSETTPKMSCQSSETTSKISCQSSETTPKISCQSSEAIMPKMSCQSSETTPKMSCQSSEAMPKMSCQSSEAMPKISRQSSEPMPKINEDNEEVCSPIVYSSIHTLDTGYKPPFMKNGGTPKTTTNSDGQTSEDGQLPSLTSNILCPTPPTPGYSNNTPQSVMPEEGSQVFESNQTVPRVHIQQIDDYPETPTPRTTMDNLNECASYTVTNAIEEATVFPQNASRPNSSGSVASSGSRASDHRSQSFIQLGNRSKQTIVFNYYNIRNTYE